MQEPAALTPGDADRLVQLVERMRLHPREDPVHTCIASLSGVVRSAAERDPALARRQRAASPAVDVADDEARTTAAQGSVVAAAVSEPALTAAAGDQSPSRAAADRIDARGACAVPGT